METMSVKEVSSWLGVSHSTVLYWIKAGELPNTTRENSIARTSPFIVPVSDVLHFLARIGKEPPAGYDVLADALKRHNERIKKERIEKKQQVAE